MNRTATIVQCLLACLTAATAQQPVRVSEPGHGTSKPRVACGGSKYLAVWCEPDERTLNAARLSSALVVEERFILAASVDIANLEVACGGDNFLVVYEAIVTGVGNIVGVIVKPVGPPSDPFGISPPGAAYHRRPAVVSNGTDFRVVWNESSVGQILGAMVTAEGEVTLLGELVNPGDYPKLVSNGTDYILVYVDPGRGDEVWGLELGTEEEFPIYQQGRSVDWPDAAYHAGSASYLVAVHNQYQELVAVLCDWTDGPVGLPLTLKQGVLSDSFAVAACGINYFIPWQQHEGQPPDDFCHVMGQRADVAGQSVGPTETPVVGSSQEDHHDPHVASDGYYYGIVWQKQERPNPAIYMDTVPAYQRHFFSRSEHATAFNQSQHIARYPGTEELHLVYMTTGQGQQTEDSVLYTRSTNSGEDWFPYEYVGAGRYPAVIVNDVGGGLGPWVAYVSADSSLVQAIRQGEGDWSYDTIFDALPVEQSVGPPSYAPCYLAPQEDVPAACAAYPVYIPSGNCWIHFSVSTQLGVEYDTVLRESSTADFPCVAVTPGDIAHVSWQEGEEHERAIYYMAYGEGGWSDTVRVSTSTPPHPISEPAAHASLEAYADFVYCVWRGPADPGDVWRGSRWLQNPPQQWYDPDTQNCTADRESDYPVMTTEYVSVWHEQVGVGGNYDIWARYVDRPAPDPLCETEPRSWFPHVTSYCEEEPPRFHCLTVWTEETNIPEMFEVVFCDSVPPSAFAEGHEPGSFYAVEVGGPKPSPYCTRRGGFREYRLFRADTSASELTYVLPYLSPRRAYLLRAVFYHEGKESWSAELRGDSSPWAKVAARPNVPETVWVRIPRETYRKDTRVEFSLRRLTGGFVSLAGLKLFQREFRDKGYELAVFGGRAQSVHTLRASPSPFTTRTSICYSLAAPGRARIDMLDATGRVVCKLVDTELAAGEHRVSWKGRDGQGRAVAAGVYFCRLLTPDAAAIDRVVLLR
jgi:hypothetical protein